MRRFDTEVAVGFFLLLGMFALTYLSIKLGKLEIIGGKGYIIYAEFSNTGGLKVDSPIEIAGVEIGRIKDITLENYQAKITLKINPGIKIQKDAIASVKTKGLLGERYIQVTPGGSEEFIPPMGKITETEPPVDLEELISKFIFGKV